MSDGHLIGPGFTPPYDFLRQENERLATVEAERDALAMSLEMFRAEMREQANDNADCLQQRDALQAERDGLAAAVNGQADMLNEQQITINELLSRMADEDGKVEEAEGMTHNYRSTLQAVCDERDALQTAIDKVLALHVPMGGNFGLLPRCSTCGEAYPCPTVRILTRGGEGT